jgi:hypothetical protein
MAHSGWLYLSEGGPLGWRNPYDQACPGIMRSPKHGDHWCSIPLERWRPFLQEGTDAFFVVMAVVDVSSQSLYAFISVG